ncbi:MAG: hypothetical protein ACI9S8_001232 [Chlamydiales bacterium]|jgi:hypothetical protein
MRKKTLMLSLICAYILTSSLVEGCEILALRLPFLKGAGPSYSKKSFSRPHDLNPSIVKEGYNLVVDERGNEVRPGGRPIQEGYKLILVDEYVQDPNKRASARVFTVMAPIRDALIFHVKKTDLQKWKALTEILTLNDIKINQWLGGPTPRDNYYSNEGIFQHLKKGPDYHPMMKYLEEAELMLKCKTFTSDFDFTNPEGKNSCPNPGTGLVE